MDTVHIHYVECIQEFPVAGLIPLVTKIHVFFKKQGTSNVIAFMKFADDKKVLQD